MREILFRGKCIDNGEWVDGDLIHNDNEDFPMSLIGSLILSRDKHDNNISFDGYCLYEVAPATIGQYTGLEDKNGTKIFEGDIVEIRFDRSVCPEVVGEVYFINGGFHIRSSDAGLSLLVYVQYCEIIGNIHDNPELLSGRK